MTCNFRATFWIIVFFAGIIALTFAINYDRIYATIFVGAYAGTFAYIIIDSFFCVKPECSRSVLWE